GASSSHRGPTWSRAPRTSTSRSRPSSRSRQPASSPQRSTTPERSWNRARSRSCGTRPGIPRLTGCGPRIPDRIEMAIGGGDSELVADRVDAAEIDVVLDREGSPFGQIARYREAPASDDRLHVHANNIGYALTMNLAMPPFDDVHIRRAVSHAIDEEALAEMLSEPKDVPFGGTSVNPGTHIAPDGIEGSLLLRAFDPYPYDPSDAREEMRASAYDRTGDGTCDAPVCRNVKTLVSDDGFIPQQAKEIRDALA